MRLRCRLLTLVAVGVLVPAGVNAQSSVTMKGTVSETLTLSVSQTSARGNMQVVSRGGNAVDITLSGDDPGSQVIRVPLLVRSNTSFKISATFKSKTALLSQLSVADVRATGTLVSAHIVNALHVKPQFDPDTSQPLLVLSGPRVSLGGTLNSPNNALQITVLVRLSPQPTHQWTAQLSFVATK
jgi:hypothetical protein